MAQLFRSVIAIWKRSLTRTSKAIPYEHRQSKAAPMLDMDTSNTQFLSRQEQRDHTSAHHPKPPSGRTCTTIGTSILKMIILTNPYCYRVHAWYYDNRALQARKPSSRSRYKLLSTDSFAFLFQALTYDKLYFCSFCAALAVSFCSWSIDFSECAWSPRSALTCIIEITLAIILSRSLDYRCTLNNSTRPDKRPSQTYRALAVTSETLVPFSLAVLLLLQLLLLERLGLFGAAVVCAESHVSTDSSLACGLVCDLTY
jgi:hypothetical protein